MNAPYNTGKVQIGAHYEPPATNTHTYETNFWQDVLLGGYAEKKKRRSYAVAYGIVVAAALFACVVWL